MPVGDASYLEEELRTSKKIGAIIREIRILREMTPGQLATKLDISPQAVWKYEKGLGVIMASRVAEVAAALDVPTAVLFGNYTPRENRIDPQLLEDTQAFLAAWGKLPSKKLKKSALEFVRSISNEQEGD